MHVSMVVSQILPFSSILLPRTSSQAFSAMSNSSVENFQMIERNTRAPDDVSDFSGIEELLLFGFV